MNDQEGGKPLFLPPEVLTDDPALWRAPTSQEIRIIVGKRSLTGKSATEAARLVGVTPQNFRRYNAMPGAKHVSEMSYSMWHLLLLRLNVQTHSDNDLFYAMLRELPKVFHDGASAARLSNMVAQHPSVAVRAAKAIEKTMHEMEAQENPWSLLQEMLDSYRNQAHILHSMLARHVSNDILKDFENEDF